MLLRIGAHEEKKRTKTNFSDIEPYSIAYHNGDTFYGLG